MGARGLGIFAGAVSALVLLGGYFGIFRGIDVECRRGGPGGGTCDVGGHVVSIDNIEALEEEWTTGNDDGRGTVLGRLVLRTRGGVIRLEGGYSSYAWDRRPLLVERFQAFLAGSDQRFSGRPHGSAEDIGGTLAALALGVAVAVSRRSRGLRFDVDADAGTVTITDLRWRVPRPACVLALDPSPIVLMQDVDGKPTVCVRQGQTEVPLLPCPSPVFERSELLTRVESALRADPPTPLSTPADES